MSLFYLHTSCIFHLPHERIHSYSFWIQQVQIYYSNARLSIPAANKYPAARSVHKVEVSCEPVDYHLFNTYMGNKRRGMRRSKIVTTIRTCFTVGSIIRISNGKSQRDKCNAVFTSLQNESITKTGPWFHQISDITAAC